ncbi:MAG: GAF domain-containing protein [Haloarculaceae archaeon]
MVESGSRLDSLCEARDRFVGGSSTEEVAQLAVESAGDVFACDACDLFLMEDGEPVREASFQSGSEQTASPAGRSVAGRTYRNREPIVVDDAAGDGRIDGEVGYRSLLSVPLDSRGVLQLRDRSPRAFDEQSLALADLFGGYVAQVLDRTERESPRNPPDDADRKPCKKKLGASRKCYQTLLEAVPDPVFVADANTGEILEVNDAAERFRGQPREEIVGLSQADLHPDGEADAYRQLFEDHIAEGGCRRRFEDGSQICATTADGRRVPVEISAEAVEIGGETVICGIFHDVSEQLEYERALTSLNGATRDLFVAEDPAEIGQETVETVASVLNRVGAAMFLVDETEVALRPVADKLPPDIEEHRSDLSAFEPGESVAWQVFTDGETAVLDDVRTDPAVHDPETPICSEILVPLGDHGVLVAGSTEPDAFDDRAVDLLEILGETVQAALDRAEREQELREREQRLEQRTRDLEELATINARIRDVTRALVDADTRQEVEQTVCTELVAADSVAFAWIGDVDPVSESVIPRAWAGDHKAYLEEITRSLADETAEPAVRATRTRERISVPNTTVDLTAEPWRDRAVRQGFNSVLSIPLLYGESFQGVLTLYATERAAFSGTLQSVLSELGELIANAEVAIDRAHALLANRTTELEFELTDTKCFFVRFAQETDCALELDEVVPQSDGSWLAFVRVSGEPTEDLIEAAQRASAVNSARVVGDDREALVQIRFTEPFGPSKLADCGISVRNITAEGSACQMTMAVPPTVSIHRAADVVSTLYPGSELIAKREQMQPPERESLDHRILEKLTPRQREVVETAYRRGYFGDPRNASGADLAEELGFSPSAFHRHIRAVQRKIFETIFDDDTPSHDRATDSQRE